MFSIYRDSIFKSILIVTIFLSQFLAFAVDKNEGDLQRMGIPLSRTLLSAVDIPLENIQIRKQTAPHDISYREVIKDMYYNGSLRSFYRGTLPRLGISALRSCYQFTFFKDIPYYIETSEQTLYLPKNLVISFAISIMDTFLINSLEFWKVRNMTRTNSQKGLHFPLKPLEYLKRGISSTFICNFLSWAVFLEIEERLRIQLKSQNPKESLHLANYFIIGGIAGALDSSITTPFHNIKNAQQKWGSVSSSFNHSARLIWEQKGVRGFYAGFLLDCARNFAFCSFYVWARNLAEYKKPSY